MKRIIASAVSLTLAVILIISFTACGKEKPVYRNDLSVTTVCNTAESCVTLANGYDTADSDYLDFYFEGAEELVEGYEIRIAKDNSNINQFGVFKVKDGSAEAMRLLCKTYLDLKMDRWVAQADYIFAEHPKMENAEVRVYGNYVVYTFLTPDDKTAVFNAIDTLLKTN